jgi:hypothetical protein
MREWTAPPGHTPEVPSTLAMKLRRPFGMALITWRYLWGTLPLHRREEPGNRRDLAPDLPDRDAEDQPVSAGSGPLYHRHFEVRIRNTTTSAEELIDRLAADLNVAVPSEATLVRYLRRARPGQLCRGDRLLVDIPGPWNGPVRVVDRGPASFRFATLRRHMEAGQIEFRAEDCAGGLRFEIEAWARPGNRVVNLLYTHLRLAKEIQFNMWARFCAQVAVVADGEIVDGLHVLTRRV